MWGCDEGAAIPESYSVGGSAVGGYLIHTAKGVGQTSAYCLSSIGRTNEGSEVQLAVCNIHSANQSWAASRPLA
jgi:hypothetical protein